MRAQNKSDWLLGCQVEDYIIYLESTWSPGMDWNNWGTHWQIDHIEPCHTFDLDDEDDLLRCFHYTNTHPVTITENADLARNNSGRKSTT